jgi:hypothetical protein
LAELAAAQHGVLTRAQALGCGAKARTIDRRVTSGEWEFIYRGVYRLAGSPQTWRQSLLLACLVWGHGAYVSHRAGAALLNLLGSHPAQSN